jgi:hypothetical protein
VEAKNTKKSKPVTITPEPTPEPAEHNETGYSLRGALDTIGSCVDRNCLLDDCFCQETYENGKNIPPIWNE